MQLFLQQCLALPYWPTVSLVLNTSNIYNPSWTTILRLSQKYIEKTENMILILLIGRLLKWMSVVQFQKTFGLWLTSSICMVSLNLVIYSFSSQKKPKVVSIACKANTLTCYKQKLVFQFDASFSSISSRDLSKNYLTGPLSPSIGNLTRLQYL